MKPFKRDMKRGRMLIPAEGKPTIPLRIYPAGNRATTLRRSTLGRPKILCWLALVIMRPSKWTRSEAGFFHPCREEQFIFESLSYAADNRATTLRRSPLAVPNALLASIADHEAFKRDTKRGRILITAEGKPTIQFIFDAWPTFDDYFTQAVFLRFGH